MLSYLTSLLELDFYIHYVGVFILTIMEKKGFPNIQCISVFSMGLDSFTDVLIY